MAGIKGETLDPAAKAKDAPNGTFLPLAQYADFESLATNRAVKLQAEAPRSKKTEGQSTISSIIGGLSRAQTLAVAS